MSQLGIDSNANTNFDIALRGGEFCNGVDQTVEPNV